MGNNLKTMFSIGLIAVLICLAGITADPKPNPEPEPKPNPKDIHIHLHGLKGVGGAGSGGAGSGGAGSGGTDGKMGEEMGRRAKKAITGKNRKRLTGSSRSDSSQPGIISFLDKVG